MENARPTPLSSVTGLPRMPGWITLGHPETLEDVAFLSGAALSHLDRVAASEDVPPALWRERLLTQLKPDLMLLVGGYAQKWHLKDKARSSLTGTVAAWRDYGPKFLPLPHPSWRNTGWLKKNPWFEAEITPWLKDRIRGILRA